MTEVPQENRIHILGAAILYFVFFAAAVGLDHARGVFRFPPPMEGRWIRMAVDAALGGAVGVAICAVLALGTKFSKSLRILGDEFSTLLGNLTNGEMFFLSAFSALGEEAFFRGFLQAEIGITWTSLLFGALHIGPGRKFLPWTILAILAGWLMGWLYEMRGDLLTPIATHFVINFINLHVLARRRKGVVSTLP